LIARDFITSIEQVKDVSEFNNMMTLDDYKEQFPGTVTKSLCYTDLFIKLSNCL